MLDYSKIINRKWIKTVFLLSGLAAALIVVLISMAYGVARWYQVMQTGKPYELGVTFVPEYARQLGVDPVETFTAILDDLNVRQLRLVSYWKSIEAEQGKYNFTELDWQFKEAENRGIKISLAVGLRQPRWPECHAPKWVDTAKHRESWQPALEKYMTAVINRYKNSPSLSSYQLENEFFNSFGSCKNFDRERLADELALIHHLDPKHPVIISRSNNYAGFAVRPPRGDINGISLYRKTWDQTVTKDYFDYPFPSWHYAFLAGMQKIIAGQDSIIHELQAEPWPPSGKFVTHLSLAEQDETLDAKRLKANVEFAKQTGIRHIDLWGAEYWYYRKTILHDDSVWQQAVKIFQG